MSNIYFAKVEEEEAKIPTKREEDAGYDLYACFKEPFICLKPNEIKLISTGIASCFDPNYVAIIKERSSSGSKGLAVRAGVIDSGFRGEWKVCLHNVSNKTLYIVRDTEVMAEKLGNEQNLWTEIMKKEYTLIWPYDKAIAQAIFIELPELEAKEVGYGDLLNFDSERRTGFLGSSGK